jgi:hypothetical protein
VVSAAPQTSAVLASYAVDAVVASRNGALAHHLDAPTWRIAASDGAHVLFLRE